MAGSRPTIPTDTGRTFEAWRSLEQIPAVVVDFSDSEPGTPLNDNTLHLTVDRSALVGKDRGSCENIPTPISDNNDSNSVGPTLLDDDRENDETYAQLDNVDSSDDTVRRLEDNVERRRIEQGQKQQRDNKLRAHIRKLRTRTGGQDRIHVQLDVMARNVDTRLNQKVLFTPLDQHLFGVQALAGTVLRDSVSGHDPERANHPERLIKAGEEILVKRTVDVVELEDDLQETKKIHTDVQELSDVLTAVANSASAHGEATGRAIAKAIISDTGELREYVSDKVRNLLAEALTPEQKSKLDPRAQKTMSDVLDEMRDDEIWELLGDTFESIPLQKSREELIKFFHSLDEENFDEALAEADFLRDNPTAFAGDSVLNDIMMKDFDTMVKVADLIEGKDYGVVQEGTGVGQIKTPIFKLPGEMDAMDKMLAKAGDNVVNIGQRATLMLLDANTDKTNGVDGAILVAIYAPQMPVHDNEFDGYMIDDLGRRVELDDEDTIPFKAGQITWRTRQWHITNDGYADMLRRMQTLKDDPATIYEPFRNPREAIVEIFPLQEALFTVRSIVAAAQLTVENVVTRLLSESASRSTNGVTTNLAVLSEIIELAKEINLPEDATSDGVEDLIVKLRDHAQQVQQNVEEIFAKMSQYVATDHNELTSGDDRKFRAVEAKAS